MAEENRLSEEQRWRIEMELNTLNTDKTTTIGVINTDVNAQWVIFAVVVAIEAAGVPVLQNLKLGEIWYPIAAFLEILLGVFWWGSTQRIQKGIDVRRRQVRDIETRIHLIASWISLPVFTDPALGELEAARFRTRHYIRLVMFVFMVIWFLTLGRGIANLPTPSILVVLLILTALIIVGVVGTVVWFVWSSSSPSHS